MSTVCVLIIVGTVFLLEIAIALILFKYIRIVNKYKNKYEKTLAKFNGTKGVKDQFDKLYDRLDKLEKSDKELEKRINNIINSNKNSINKVELLKYNAYDDTDNKLSFALAVVNENNNGLLFNQIYSKHGTNMYVKKINEGNVKERMCEEEQKVVQLACEEK